MSLFAVDTFNRDLTESQLYCIMGAVVLSLIKIYIYIFSFLWYFLSGNMFHPDPQKQTFEYNPLKKSLRASYTSIRWWKKKAMWFFFSISGIFGFPHRHFGNLLTVLFFYVTVLLSVLQLFSVVLWGLLFTWWQWQLADVRWNTALRVIVTSIIITIIIMYTALLFLLQFCGLPAILSMLWLTVMNYKSHECNTTLTPHPYCVLSTGMMAFPPPNTNKGLSLLTDRGFWCLAMCFENVKMFSRNHHTIEANAGSAITCCSFNGH